MALKVHMKFDGTNWTDVSDKVLYEDGIRISPGTGNQGGQVDTTTCSFSLLNDTGDFTPGNPVGAYYPNVNRNVPVRVSALEGDVGLLITRTNDDYITTPDDASLDITGDIDVRIEASLWNWITPGAGAIGSTELIGKFVGPGQYSWTFEVRDGFPYFEWSTDGTNLLNATAATRIYAQGSAPRQALRVTMDVNNGAGGKTVTFYRAETIDGPWEAVGSPVTTAGTTSIFNSTTTLAIGDASSTDFSSGVGVFHKAEVRNGIDGTVVANPDFTAQTSGVTSFADAAGRTWTVQGQSEITSRKIRFLGEVASWQPKTRRTNFKYTEIEAGGIMRRLGATDNPLESAVYRDLTNPSRTGIVAYWPMEEESDADGFTSPFEGTRNLVSSSAGIDRAAYTLWAASSPLPTFTSGSVLGAVPAYATSAELSVRTFWAPPATGVAATQNLIELNTTGTARRWVLSVNTSGHLRLQIFSAGGTSVGDTGFIVFATNGKLMMLTLEATQNGTDIDWAMITTEISSATRGSIPVTSFTGTLNLFTKGQARTVRLGGSGALDDTALGHLTVASDTNAYSGTGASLLNWKWEDTSDRLLRVGTEEGITVLNGSLGITRQGGQGETDIVTILRDAATADGGTLCEWRDGLGFHYRSPESLSSQTPTMVLPYSTGPVVDPLDPVWDDDVTVNDYTASRRDGGSTRVQETSGVLSVSDPPSGAGRYRGGDTYNVAEDVRTGDLGGWAVHVGTFEGARVARLTVKLQKSADLITDACRTYVGDIIKITGAPVALFGTDTILLKVEGYQEELDQYQWEITYNCSPGELWNAAFVSYDAQAWQASQFAWADTAGSVLAEALTSTETDVDILTTSGERWTSDPADSPYLLKAAGEIVRVTAPGGLVNDNPLFASSVTGWEAVGSAIAHDAATVIPHPDAAGSLKVTPDGVTAAVGARSAHTPAGSITPGGSYVASGWLFSGTASSDVRFVIDWYDSADVLLSSSLGSASSLVASTWTYLDQTLTAPASASRAAVRTYRGGTPAVGAVTYHWAVRITRLKASTVFDNFGRTATNTWTIADSSQTWTNTGGAAADYDVLSGYGRHINPAVSTGHHSVTAAPNADFDIYCDITTAALSTGASQFAGILARFADADNLYEARLEFTTANAINLTIRERVASVETQLGTFSSTLTHVAATFVRVRFRGSGTSLKAKVWAVTAKEPVTWGVEVTDSSITAAGSLGVKSARNAGNTNANAEFRFDTLDLITPQTFVVERSVNAVTKTQAAAEAVSLAVPAVAAL